MKYIRTKDRIWLSEKIGYDESGHAYSKITGFYQDFTKKDIIAQADTIEELCDGFWWENTMYKEPIFIPNYGLVLDRVKAWKENDKELNDNSFDRITIYGSIYIHGYGWKHVCKVNKSEERLELL